MPREPGVISELLNNVQMTHVLPTHPLQEGSKFCLLEKTVFVSLGQNSKCLLLSRHQDRVEKNANGSNFILDQK